MLRRVAPQDGNLTYVAALSTDKWAPSDEDSTREKKSEMRERGRLRPGTTKKQARETGYVAVAMKSPSEGPLHWEGP
jgi:hypothetical protein